MIDLHGHGKKYFIIYSDSILFSFLVKILKKKTFAYYLCLWKKSNPDLIYMAAHMVSLVTSRIL